jgi:tetratricopeptide (TPR) repeat protein
MKNEWRLLAAVCVLVIGMYAYTAPLGRLESSISNPSDTYYNLLVRGFRDGHLSLKKEVPVGLTQLADPYDPYANRRYQDLPYGLRDMSYYKGRLYIYFGVTPALILFWPFVALTGHYLSDRQAVMIFCAVGFLASVGLLRALWRRHFAEVSVGVVVVCALALGIATGVTTILPRSCVHEVTTSCDYMLTMLALVAIWKALHDVERRGRWLAVASLAYGLAVGARPNLLFGAVILLVPVVQAWPERRRVWQLLVAVIVPIALIGLGLMIYNAIRFGSPFEFGWRYQLAGKSQLMIESFSPRYLWFNFQINFLAPARWSARFPFVHPITVPPWPVGYYEVDPTFGILTNIPLVWLALAAPLAWRGRHGQEASVLRWFVVAIALLVCACVLTVGFFCASNTRYAVDFLPALILLAVIGILGCERALAPTSESGLADQPLRRRLVRWGWSVLLGFSVVFNVLVSVVNYANIGCGLASLLVIKGRVQEAIRVFENSLRITPDYVEGHVHLGKALCRAGLGQEAIREEQYALRLDPASAEAHYVYGVALEQLREIPQAIVEYQQALRINPNFAEAHNNLGIDLAQSGQTAEAIAHYEQALRIDPDYAEAHNNLGTALAQAGKIAEAIAHYQQALRINPDFAEAHYNLGIDLAQSGQTAEAIAHYQQALRINPNYAEAHDNLGTALAQSGKFPEAIAHYEQALRINPDYAEAHYNLGLALKSLGRTQEAIEHYQQALKLRPDFAAASNALARLQAGQTGR